MHLLERSHDSSARKWCVTEIFSSAESDNKSLAECTNAELEQKFTSPLLPKSRRDKRRYETESSESSGDESDGDEEEEEGEEEPHEQEPVEGDRGPLVLLAATRREEEETA